MFTNKNFPLPVRTIIIGLDCFEPSLVDRWINDLPTFARLRALGVWGRMRSCVPPITVPAWSVMTSSRDPGTLGIYGFRNRTKHTYTDLGFATSDWVRVERLWDVLARAGKKCGVLGVPGTFPVRPVPGGALVSCFLTPNDQVQWTSPPEFKNEIVDWLGGEKYIFDVVEFRTIDKARVLADIHEMTRRRFTVAREWLAKHAPDFFMMVEMGSDRIHHSFWHYMDPQHRKYEPGHPLASAIHDYYVQLDGEIARLLELIDLRDTSLLLISDHGAKRLDGGICVNEWLRREGWLVLKNDAVPRGTPLAKCDVDWSRTRAWGDGGYYARICFNVKGREPQGVVEPADFEKTRDELAAKLCAIPDDRGRPMRTVAHKPQELYSQVTGIAPDLIVIFDDLHWRSVGTLGYDSIYTLDNDTGPDEANHAQHGFFNWIAPTIAPRAEPLDIDILDVAPTVLAHWGRPVEPGMLGKPLTF
ncbi:MAG: alkaline phosphatase family protein [Verrucomicrobia bacterium]|nr:alkaline phosphatase family protein [Verrucomicrobiota bacterium]